MRKWLPAVLALLIFVGCDAAPRRDVGKSESKPVVKEVERGPLKLRLLLDRDTLSVADTLTLAIEADIQEGYDVELPAFGEKLGEFGILDYREEAPRTLPHGRTLTRKVYRLDPFLSGDYQIAPMTVRFREKQGQEASEPTAKEGSADSGWHELQTEEVPVKVLSLVGEDRSRLQLKPIFGPVSLPREVPYFMIAVVTLLLIGTAGTAAFLLIRRRKGRAGMAVSPPAAHELAYRQLEELLAEGLPEQGEYKRFFARVSDVLRVYVENRFGLHAPRRTTEEFLADISHGSGAWFSPDQRALLDDFLHRCDLVKFAEHLPTPGEMGGAVDACRAFIRSTAQPSAGEEGRP